MNKWLITFFVCFCLYSQQANACLSLYSTLTHDELINNSTEIVLAKVIKAELINDKNFDHWNIWARKLEYTFIRIDNLRGHTEETFIWVGRPTIFSRDMENYSDHNDLKFWNDNEGRTPYNCEVIYNAFAVGADYLLFGGGKDTFGHAKASEIILRKDDKWLAYVREKVKEQQNND